MRNCQKNINGLIMIDNLFATPVFTDIHSNFDFLNDGVMKEAQNISDLNLFNTNTQAIKTLKNWIKGHVDDMVEQYGFGYNKIAGRINIIKPFGSDTPHHHVNLSTLVGVYYVDVPKNSGDILLHDPRGALPWSNLGFNPDDPIANKSSRCYHRIKPQNGLLVLFPSFLIHSVETNLSNQNRISIVINVHY
jgi:uncharacterized protein (TIGR02466 family)